MPSAAIDVGSNTLRLLIGSVTGDKVSRLYTDRVITRLAERLGETGRLGEENMKRSLSALKSFAGSMSRFGVRDVKAVGTSALRDAENSEAFIAAAYAESGIRIEVVSGRREAELTSRGVLAGFHHSTGASLIIDIGGGSTEWIVQDAEVFCQTVPLGVVGLAENFLKTDPPAAAEIAALVGTIDMSLRSDGWDIPTGTRQFERLVGTGGTITTLASIDLGLKKYDHEAVHMRRLTRSRLYRIRDRLIVLTLKERQDIAGLEAGRADLIIPGVLLTMRVMENFGFTEITASDSGLLEGLLKEIDDEKGL
ncbi:MAG TPA: Ppx/GppA phosphatase family protein [Thermodesulfovibrionales bacterium]|nr:Ppx/GppA phosphatase family protein [Thermodesulfovibrionales bacterium]